MTFFVFFAKFIAGINYKDMNLNRKNWMKHEAILEVGQSYGYTSPTNLAQKVFATKLNRFLP